MHEYGANTIADFENARDLMNAVIAEYSSRISEVPNGARKDYLLDEQARYARHLRRFNITDTEDIKWVLKELPRLLERLRSRLT